MVVENSHLSPSAAWSLFFQVATLYFKEVHALCCTSTMNAYQHRACLEGKRRAEEVWKGIGKFFFPWTWFTSTVNISPVANKFWLFCMECVKVIIGLTKVKTMCVIAPLLFFLRLAQNLGRWRMRNMILFRKKQAHFWLPEKWVQHGYYLILAPLQYWLDSSIPLPSRKVKILGPTLE